jgi:hypothetical protein
MSAWLRWFCRLIMLLEWIPAYRRMYIWNEEAQRFSDPHWRWFPPRRGMWGIAVLTRLNLFHRYLDTLEWVEVERPEEET